jgi:hypothetical protein
MTTYMTSGQLVYPLDNFFLVILTSGQLVYPLDIIFLSHP